MSDVVEIIEIGGVGPPGPAREIYQVASESAMLALAAHRGDLAIRGDTDPEGYWELVGANPADLLSWRRWPVGVISVNGLSGEVELPIGGEEYDVATPSTVWLVTHTLPWGQPVVTTLNSAGERIEGDASYPSATQVRIEFSVPVAGTVQLR